MARKPNVYRQLALAEALASFTPEREIVKKFAREWGLRPDSVRKMMQKLIADWRDEPISKPGEKSLSPWQVSPKARERMKVLGEALRTKSRRDVVRTYAEQWGLTESWVDEMITRVIVESHEEIEAQAQRELAIYIARIRAHLDRYREHRDHPSITKAFDRLALLTKPGP